jgi:hypothetical protein
MLVGIKFNEMQNMTVINEFKQHGEIIENKNGSVIIIIIIIIIIQFLFIYALTQQAKGRLQSEHESKKHTQSTKQRI